MPERPGVREQWYNRPEKFNGVSEFFLLSGFLPPTGWLWTAVPGSFLPFSFPQASLHSPHSPMETNAKALECPLDPCSRAGDSWAHRSLGGSGSYHGIIVAVHHDGAPASEVDVLFPPVTDLWRVRCRLELRRANQGHVDKNKAVRANLHS